MEHSTGNFTRFTILAFLLDNKKFNYQQFQKIFSFGVILLLASTVVFTPYSLSPYSSQFAFALSESETSPDTISPSSTEEILSPSDPTPSEETESFVESSTSPTDATGPPEEFNEGEIIPSSSTDTSSIPEFSDGVVIISSSTTLTAPNATESYASLSLDGVYDYTTEEATNSTNHISEMTLSAWVKPDYSSGSPEFTVISKENSFVLSVNNLVTPQKVASFSVFDGIKWTTVNT